jgi:hypothetical protein
MNLMVISVILFQVEVLFHTLGFFILVSLLRRARKMYDIRGNQCQVSSS